MRRHVWMGARRKALSPSKGKRDAASKAKSSELDSLASRYERLYRKKAAGRGGADEEERSHLLEGSLRAMYRPSAPPPPPPPSAPRLDEEAEDPEYRRMMYVAPSSSKPCSEVVTTISCRKAALPADCALA